ncbi:hypothetical protein EPO15_15975 [bacterium]|nr:MAG: hypothetical protein EPO15_15975 [bacterium]
MDTKTLKDVLAWMRSTDLVEVSYKRSGAGFELCADGAVPAPAGGFPEARVVPVSSPEVGVFRTAGRGASFKGQPGDAVEAGSVLGVIDTGAKTFELKAPSAGKLVGAGPDDGKAVEYGQPLFFIAPR